MRHPLLALLHCPICSNPLHSPVTLSCGHTLCAEHYAHPCPIPTCSYNARPSSSSSVSDFTPQHSVHPSIHPLKVDVTISKALDLLSRPVPSPETHDRSRFPSSGNDGESEEDDETPEDNGTASGHRPNSSPPGSPRPRKRRRRYSSPGAHDPPEQDLVEHLRLQSARQRDVPRDVPLVSVEDYSSNCPAFTTIQSTIPSPDVAIRKQLLVELTCEICYMLLYQPITTPCQHVGRHVWDIYQSSLPRHIRRSATGVSIVG